MRPLPLLVIGTAITFTSGAMAFLGEIDAATGGFFLFCGLTMAMVAILQLTKGTK